MMKNVEKWSDEGKSLVAREEEIAPANAMSNEGAVVRTWRWDEWRKNVDMWWWTKSPVNCVQKVVIAHAVDWKWIQWLCLLSSLAWSMMASLLLRIRGSCSCKIPLTRQKEHDNLMITKFVIQIGENVSVIFPFRGVCLVSETKSGLLSAHCIIGPPFVDLKSLSTMCNVWGCHGKQEGRGRQGRGQATACFPSNLGPHLTVTPPTRFPTYFLLGLSRPGLSQFLAGRLNTAIFRELLWSWHRGNPWADKFQISYVLMTTALYTFCVISQNGSRVVSRLVRIYVLSFKILFLVKQ